MFYGCVFTNKVPDQNFSKMYYMFNFYDIICFFRGKSILVLAHSTWLVTGKICRDTKHFSKNSHVKEQMRLVSTSHIDSGEPSISVQRWKVINVKLISGHWLDLWWHRCSHAELGFVTETFLIWAWRRIYYRWGDVDENLQPDVNIQSSEQTAENIMSFSINVWRLFFFLLFKWGCFFCKHNTVHWMI